MTPRRPRAHAHPLALPIAAALAATLGACAAPDAPGRATDPGPFGRAMRALRRETVGDRRLEAGRPTPRDSGRANRGAPAPRPEPRAVAPTARAPAPTPWDTTEVPSHVIPFTSVAGAPDTVWLGDTLVLAPPAAPAGTPSAIVRGLRWTSAEPSVATVSAEGVVTPRTVGEAEIVAWRRVGQTITRVTVLPAVRGRVVAADGPRAPLRVRVSARAGDWADTAWTDDDGAFAFRPAPPPAAPVTLRFEPDGAGHAPALLAAAPIGGLHDLDVVLLPRRWRVPAGSYAGTTVDIDPAVAYATVRDARRLWRVARPGRDGAADGGHAVGWSPGRLPLPLALDHRGAGGAIGPADSVAFWGIVRQLERDWGAPLFRPATLPAGDDGIGGVVATVDPQLRSAGLTTTGWNGDGDLYDAVVAVRTRALLADPAIVTHELLHALGVGHAPNALASVMHPVTDPAGAGRASAADVAYGQLLYAVRARARPGRTAVGVAEAAAAAAPRP